MGAPLSLIVASKVVNHPNINGLSLSIKHIFLYCGIKPSHGINLIGVLGLVKNAIDKGVFYLSGNFFSTFLQPENQIR